MNAQSVSHPRAAKRNSSLKKSPDVAPASVPWHFNARGVVETPDFAMNHPAAGGGIRLTIQAHCLGDRQWIAEPIWGCLCGHLPHDGLQPHTGSIVYQSRSEAVEHGLDTGLGKIRQQLGALAKTPEWRQKVQAVETWATEAIVQSRENDETLILHGTTVIDLCSGGLGGFGLGLASLGAEVVLACEIDPEARRVYQRNVKPRDIHHDLCTLDGTKLKCDILTLGLLCQAFSTAGKHQGLADPVRNDVYRHSLRLAGEIDAKVVIIECARQLLTHDGGADAEVVLNTLMRAGYRVQHRTLNASGFGLAQSRERSFIVATRLGLPVDDIMGYVFPTEQAPTACVEDILEHNVPHSIADDQFVLHRVVPTERQSSLIEVGLLKTVKTQRLLDAQGYRLYSAKGLGAALTATGGGRATCTGVYLVNGKARGLTPREASRMQGMPEWASHHQTTSHALKHAGNAVAVPVARELGRQLGNILSRRS
ncbi:DNA cytosine methyltransferase [Massilia frigida]|uniref:DNA cytosine methyltransferase n=1 Tax=Massilia frigida TaxID=2609281 RepID=UPI00141F74F4